MPSLPFPKPYQPPKTPKTSSDSDSPTLRQEAEWLRDWAQKELDSESCWLHDSRERNEWRQWLLWICEDYEEAINAKASPKETDLKLERLLRESLKIGWLWRTHWQEADNPDDRQAFWGIVPVLRAALSYSDIITYRLRYGDHYKQFLAIIMPTLRKRLQLTLKNETDSAYDALKGKKGKRGEWQWDHLSRALREENNRYQAAKTPQGHTFPIRQALEETANELNTPTVTPNTAPRCASATFGNLQDIVLGYADRNMTVHDSLEALVKQRRWEELDEYLDSTLEGEQSIRKLFDSGETLMAPLTPRLL